MFTTAKKTADVVVNQIPTVSFLYVDGSQKEEDIVFNSDINAYVSRNDYSTYGKVEVYSADNTKHYLKQFRGGRPGELLVDPYGMFARAEDLSAYATQRGHRFCEYVEVTPDVFQGYVAYLKTRDSRYFRYCEKSVIDKTY